MFLKALLIKRGTVASMGYPAERESPVMFLTPFANEVRRVDGSRLRRAYGKMHPSSYTVWIFIPYSNGFKFNFLRRAASEALTFLPTVQTLKSLVIYIWPFTILVEIINAWKKLICDGSSPVGPAGTVKSTGATTPILASVGILFA